MEDFVLSALIIQGVCGLAILVGCAADALVHRVRPPRYWAASPPPAFPESVYDLQDAGQDPGQDAGDVEVLPRAA